jgi:hypothetical protein
MIATHPYASVPSNEMRTAFERSRSIAMSQSQVAKLLTSPDRSKIDLAIKMIAQNPRLFVAVSNADAACGLVARSL